MAARRPRIAAGRLLRRVLQAFQPEMNAVVDVPEKITQDALERQQIPRLVFELSHPVSLRFLGSAGGGRGVKRGMGKATWTTVESVIVMNIPATKTKLTRKLGTERAGQHEVTNSSRRPGAPVVPVPPRSALMISNSWLTRW